MMTTMMAEEKKRKINKNIKPLKHLGAIVRKMNFPLRRDSQKEIFTAISVKKTANLSGLRILKLLRNCTSTQKSR